MVMVDPKKFDEAWQKDESYYLPPGAEGKSEVKGRREGVEKFLESDYGKVSDREDALLISQAGAWSGADVPSAIQRQALAAGRSSGTGRVPARERGR